MSTTPTSTVTNSQAKILVLGGTGLVGSNFLKEAQKSSFISKIITISRRELPPQIGPLSKLSSIVEPDTAKWNDVISQMESFDIVFSGIGTTKGDAKGFENQKLIDHDLNLRLAKASKAKGVEIFMMVTSFNNPYLTLAFPYFALKKQIEDDIIKLGFQKTIFLRPGPLVGDRSLLKPKQSFASTMSSIIASITYNTPCSTLLGVSIKAQEVAEAGMFLLETNVHLEGVQYVTSQEMFELAYALEGI